jgi:pimeloyl-ACP methyl ester carboxylesterase
VIRPAADEPQGAMFVLIPGAGGMAWDWHRIVPLLKKAQHEAIAIDLPADDPKAGLSDYADIVVRAIGAWTNVVLVAQSLGGFTAPLVCARTRVRMLILVNAMIPRPGETAEAWWQNTRSADSRVTAAQSRGYSTTCDVPTYFLHDVPKAVLRTGPARQRDQAESIFEEPCRFEHWPRIPIHVITSADDRFFPLEFQQRIARERLGKETRVLPGGHLVALARPQELAEELLRLERGVRMRAPIVV